MANSVESKKLFSYIFIFALAVLFALQWGPGSKGITRRGGGASEKPDVAATVNGKEIPMTEFSRAYAGQLQNWFWETEIFTPLPRSLTSPASVAPPMQSTCCGGGGSPEQPQTSPSPMKLQTLPAVAQ